ncbi:MAG TPA: CAP domain-containing protein [Rubrobacteraceae bacterium]
MRCLLVVFVAIFIAAAGLIRVDSSAEAAGGGYASRCGGGEIFLYASEKRLLTLHNNARKNHGLKPFCVHPSLQKAARAHSKDMIQRDYFSHDTRGRNEDPCTRFGRFGYHSFYCGENIGYNATPEGMFRSWMRSSIHRPNILDGRFHEIGIGACTGDYSDSKTTMYTADFGAPAEQRSD